MSSRTRTAGGIDTGIGIQLRRLIYAWRWRLAAAGAAAGGALMSGASLFGTIAPFGAALCAALPWKYVPPAALGAVVGYVFSPAEQSGMGHIAATLLVVISKWLFSQCLVKMREQLAAVCAALFATVLSSVLILVTMSSNLYDILSAVSEVMLCCGAAYFFSQSFASLGRGLHCATRAERSCVAISFSVLVTGLSPIGISSVSFGRIIAVLVILLAARHAKEAGGAVAGVISGVAMGFGGADFGYTLSAYAFGGLISGVFGHIGRLAAAAAFIIVNALSAIFIGSSVDAYSAVIEIFAASVIFMLVPAGAMRHFRAEGGTFADILNESASKTAMHRRMDDISATLRGISETTHEVSRRLEKHQQDSPDLCAAAVARVCKHCEQRQACWKNEYSQTMVALGDFARTLQQNGTLSREAAPEYLASNCGKLDSITEELNTQFRLKLSREGVAHKVAQVRSVVADQFEGMSLMLDELAEDLASRKRPPYEQQQRVREFFRRIRLNYDELFCYVDSLSRINIELRLPAAPMPRFDRIAVTLELSELLETDFELPQEEEYGCSLVVLFSERAAFSADIGKFQLSSGSNRLCGDSCETLRDRTGRQHLILSDGMGSGGGAAVDSAMASGLISRLLAVGVSHQAALKMVNSALLIKSGDESLATIDVCSIDLFTGKAGFYKAGAAPTYVWHGGMARILESTSLPAGILRGIAFEQSSMTLTTGDIVLMVSDGVTATGSEWVCSELQMLADCDLQELCEKIAKTATIRRTDSHSDDVTVLAARMI